MSYKAIIMDCLGAIETFRLKSTDVREMHDFCRNDAIYMKTVSGKFPQNMMGPVFGNSANFRLSVLSHRLLIDTD